MDIRNYFNVTPVKKSKTNNFFEKPEVIKKKKTPKNMKIDRNYELYEAFADGSSFNNGHKNHSLRSGGIGVYFPNYSQHNISKGLDKLDKITNNVAELLACIQAIKFFLALPQFNQNCDKIIVYTDSSYTINSMTNWGHTWRKNNWQKYNVRKKKYQEIQNKELIVELYNLSHKGNYKVQYVHVRSHQPEPKHLSQDDIIYKMWLGNKIADKLATDANKKKYSNII